jgi:hypothetical protein
MGRRLDRAWQRGFEAGRKEWKRVIPVAMVLGGIALTCRRGVPMMVKVAVFYGLLFALLVAVVLAPLAGLVLILRMGVRHQNSKTIRGRVGRLGLILS